MAVTQDQLVQLVWEKALVIAEYNQDEWRQDPCKAWIQRSKHGDRTSVFGWEMGHIKPASQGGLTILLNLRPLQWENNSASGDGRLTCRVSEGSKVKRLPA